MHYKASLLALLVSFLWGANFIVIKLGVAELPPLALLSVRFILTGLIFVPFIKWPGLKKAAMIASIGLLMGLLHQGFLYVGLQMMPAGLMSIILQSNIVLATLIGWFVFKEHIGWRTWTGIALGLVGIGILVGGPELYGPWIGYIYGLLSALFIALTYVMMKKIDHVHAPTYIGLMSLPIAPFIALSSFMFEGTEWLTQTDQINWAILAPVIFYQVVIIAFSHILWQRLMVQNPMSQVIPWTLLIPVFGVIIGMLVFGEALTVPILLGGGLTIAGVAIITFRKIKKEEK
ncbi:MAG: EamA family transporter [Pseudomonadota bacterium]